MCVIMYGLLKSLNTVFFLSAHWELGLCYGFCRMWEKHTLEWLKLELERERQEGREGRKEGQRDKEGGRGMGEAREYQLWLEYNGDEKTNLGKD